MKFNLWRLFTLFVVGILIGLSAGVYTTTKVFLNNIPATTEITIGKIKVRGNDNVVAPDIETKIENNDNSTIKIFVRTLKTKLLSSLISYTIDQNHMAILRYSST